MIAFPGCLGDAELLGRVFMARDLVALFTLFFEAGLIRCFLIIGIWGGANRKFKTHRSRFFLYTFLGSVPDAGAMVIDVCGMRARLCIGRHAKSSLP